MGLLGKIIDRYRDGGIRKIFFLIRTRIKYVFIDTPRANRIIRREKKIERRKAGDYRPHRIWRGFLRAIGIFVYWPMILKNKRKKILVVVHIFYMRSIDEIVEYLKNLNKYHYDLIVTYIDNYYDESLFEKIKIIKPDTIFRKYKNNGFDIGPFIDVINNTDLKKYDAVIKMQSKGTKRNIYIYGQFFSGRDWFRDLWNGVLGCFSVHKTINKICNNKKIGLVAARNLIVHDPIHKQELTKQALEEYKLPFIDNYYFVAGSCFAIKPICLERIKEMNISPKAFQKTAEGFFSFAHAIERGVCYCIMPKYKFYGNRVDFWRHAKWYRVEKKIKEKAALNMIAKLGDYRVTPEYAWQVLEHSYLRKAVVEDIRLDQIKREHPITKKRIGLSECEPYLYLKGGKKNIDKYREYCAYHINENGLPNMTIDRFEKLIASVKKDGYDPHVPIFVDHNNVILDGQHRACILMDMYGGGYVIPVIKLWAENIPFGELKPFTGKLF